MNSPRSQRLRSAKTLTARKIGNWNEAIRFCKSMGKDVRQAAIDGQWEQAKKLKQIIIGHILAQDLPWQPLSPKTVRNKRQNKRMIYVDTEKFLEAIALWKDGDRVFMGVKKGITYKRKDGNVTVDQVAIWNEFGTRRAPARPLWNPSIAEMGGAKKIRDNIADTIYRRLKWLSRGTPMQVTKGDIRKMFKANARTNKY